MKTPRASDQYRWLEWGIFGDFLQILSKCRDRLEDWLEKVIVFLQGYLDSREKGPARRAAAAESTAAAESSEATPPAPEAIPEPVLPREPVVIARKPCILPRRNAIAPEEDSDSPVPAPAVDSTLPHIVAVAMNPEPAAKFSSGGIFVKLQGETKWRALSGPVDLPSHRPDEDSEK